MGSATNPKLIDGIKERKYSILLKGQTPKNKLPKPLKSHADQFLYANLLHESMVMEDDIEKGIDEILAPSLGSSWEMGLEARSGKEEVVSGE